MRKGRTRLTDAAPCLVGIRCGIPGIRAYWYSTETEKVPS